MMRGDRRGCVKLKDAQVGIDNEDDSTFTITVDHKTFHFQARDYEERQKWLEALQEARDLHTKNYGLFPPSLAQESGSSLTEFDRRLTEADVYLQVLIEQHLSIEERITSQADEDQKVTCESLLVRVKSMIELVKQTIFCLQMAKQNALSILSVPTVFPTGKDLDGSVDIGQDALTESLETSVDATDAGGGKRQLIHQDATAARVGSAGSSSGGGGGKRGQPPLTLPAIRTTDGVTQGQPPKDSTSSQEAITPTPDKQALVPAVSYSSSEDEEFFDTEEDILTSPRHFNQSRSSSNGDSVFVRGPSRDGELSTEGEDGSRTPRSDSPTAGKQLVGTVIRSANDIYDELYDEDEEDYDDSVGSVHAHGSVISYLLSQLRIGMDLTKISLPTFILEKRSTLEMYADFLAHADLWAIIGDPVTVQDRMVACLRWYMSAFHAGRKSSVAKKPYNPILGEIFQCYWDVAASPYLAASGVGSTSSAAAASSANPGGGRGDNNTSPLLNMTQPEPGETIPMPWAPETSVVFLAEQVSHHPPISAFYAEHRAKGISIDGYLWTKSKFLGLSISVEMVGESVISLLEYDEEYIITFPCGYGRNILTVPWVELGGKCTITCAKTGYHATVEFKTKPFYGGKRDQVKAECFAPGEKKPFLTVDGEWNDKMWAKWADGKNELFLDTKAMPVIKKQVLPRSEQESYESRRMWENVTRHLKSHNIEEATNAKVFLEQRQRAEAKHRQERGLKWQTRHFGEVGEHWVYHHPLVKRAETRRAKIDACFDTTTATTTDTATT